MMLCCKSRLARVCCVTSPFIHYKILSLFLPHKRCLWSFFILSINRPSCDAEKIDCTWAGQCKRFDQKHLLNKTQKLFFLFFNYSFNCKSLSLILCIKLIPINLLKCGTPKQAHHLEHWENSQWAIGLCAGGTVPIQMEQLTDLSSAAHYWKQKNCSESPAVIVRPSSSCFASRKASSPQVECLKIRQVKRKKGQKLVCCWPFLLLSKCNGFCHALHRSELIILSSSWHMLHALLHVQRVFLSGLGGEGGCYEGSR